jgi:hypothetical protein
VRRAPICAVAAAGLAFAGTASAAQPPQKFVLPGPVPYATAVPPLAGKTALPQIYIAPRLHVSSDQRVFVGVDAEGRPAAVSYRGGETEIYVLPAPADAGVDGVRALLDSLD